MSSSTARPDPDSTSMVAAPIPPIGTGGGDAVLDHVAISPDGHLALVRATTVPTGVLAVMQAGVGGDVERLGVRPDLDAWVNEEGIPRGLPVNPVATAVVADLSGRPPIPLYGTVLFLSSRGADVTSLSTAWQQMLIDAWAAVLRRAARSNAAVGRP